MKSCVQCENVSTCSSLCKSAEAYANLDYRALREVALGASVELIGSSCAHKPNLTPFPEFGDKLRPIEGRILKYYYEDGFKLARIARKLKKKKTYIKTTLRMARVKIGSFSSIVERIR